MTALLTPRPPVGLSRPLRGAWRQGFVAAQLGQTACPFAVARITVALRKQWNAGFNAGRLAKAEGHTETS